MYHYRGGALRGTALAILGVCIRTRARSRFRRRLCVDLSLRGSTLVAKAKILAPAQLISCDFCVVLGGVTAGGWLGGVILVDAHADAGEIFCLALSEDDANVVEGDELEGLHLLLYLGGP